MSIGFDPPSIPVWQSAANIVVGRYDVEAETFSKLDNVRCERIEYRMGSTPGAAQFSYILDNSGAYSDANYPTSFEDVWPLGDASKALAIGTEIIVYAVDSNNEVDVLFHGHVENPQINVTGQGQGATFTAADVSMRCFDRPIGGAYQRDANDPQEGRVTQTDLVARFNPDGNPNATPGGYDVDQGEDTSHPVFLDSTLVLDPDQRRFWTLGMFARSLFQTRDTDELKWVDSPTAHFADETIDHDLQSIKPASGNAGPIDLDDPSTYVAEDILIDDVVASDRPWPEVLETTLNRHGFDMRFDLNQKASDTSGSPPVPTHKVILSRSDGTFEPNPLDLYLQDGDALDPGKTNVGQLSAMRDAHGIQNQFAIASKLNRYEASFVLAPLFAIDAGDASDSNTIAGFSIQASASENAAVRTKYRWYGVDEASEGHWDYTAAAIVDTTPFDFSPILGSPDASGNPQYVVRHRPALGTTLLSEDDSLRPRKVQLAISKDYSGKVPSVWDGTGSWQDTGGLGWKLLKDRLGIEITVENPNAWTIAKAAGAANVMGGANVIRAIEAQATPTSSTPQFYLRLTCVIEGDQSLDVTAKKRDFSPSPFTVARSIEGRDVYEKQVVHSSSVYGANETATPRDDTMDALSQANAFRSQNEFPRVTARVMIPRLSLAYKVGDRIRKIIGREIDFRSNGGASAKESPRYPTVVGVTFDFSANKQTTTLELSDGDRVVDRRAYRQTNQDEE